MLSDMRGAGGPADREPAGRTDVTMEWKPPDWPRLARQFPAGKLGLILK
jgi:hypothetical protein